MVKIKQIEPGLYEVNGKGVDTRFPGWGRNLTADEYQELQKFRIVKKQENSLNFGKYAGIPISEFDSKEKTDYLYWLVNSVYWYKVNPELKGVILKHLNKEV